MSEFSQIIIRQSDGTIFTQDFWLDHFLYETMYRKEFIEQDPAYIRYYFKKLDKFNAVKKIKAEEQNNYRIYPEEDLVIFLDFKEKTIFSNKNIEWGQIDPNYLKNHYLVFTKHIHQYHQIISKGYLTIEHYKVNPENNLFELINNQKIETIDEFIHLVNNELISIHLYDNTDEFHLIQIDFPLLNKNKYFSSLNEKEKNKFVKKLTEIGFIHKKR